MLIVAPIEMLVQRFHKARIPASPLDQFRNVMHHIERIYPFIAFNYD